MSGPLSLAAVIALSGACQSVVDPVTMAGIAAQESGGVPFAIHDNADNRRYAPVTKPEAAALAHRLIDAGHSIDVGLTQINRFNFPWLSLTVETALDPCRNIAAGAQVLVAYSRYNTGSPSAGIANGYAMKVSAAVRTVRTGEFDARPSAPSVPADVSIFARPKSGRELVFTATEGK